MTSLNDKLYGRSGLASTVLIVDDDPSARRAFSEHLTHLRCHVETANDGVSGVKAALDLRPDLILLDVMLPDVNGFVVCRRLKSEPLLEGVPIVLITASTASDAHLHGLEAGADDFVTKPFRHAELEARVRSLLRLKFSRDQIVEQKSALAEWSRLLEERVAEKFLEVERLNHLKRFFSPQLAARLLAEDRESVLDSHRQEVTVLFVDLCGFTAFAEEAVPDVVMQVLRNFHAVMGELVFRFGGTLERFTGDGMMVFFNDPDPIQDHCAQAMRLAIAMMDAVETILPVWQREGGPKGVAIGIDRGEVTLGAIGFEGRLDYAAIGSTTNLAARLCDEARPSEILVSERAWGDLAEMNLVGEKHLLVLKGFAQPVPCRRVAKTA